MSDSDSRCYLELHEVFVALETKRLCKYVSLVMVWPGEQYIVVLFRHNLPQPTQAQLMRGAPKHCVLSRGVVLSCRFAEWKVRRAPRVLRMAVVSQSSVKFGKKRVFLVGTINFIDSGSRKT